MPEIIDDDRRLVADHPRVVAGRQQRDVAGAELVFAAVVHPYAQTAGHVVLEVRRLAALGSGDGLDVGRPAPAGLKGGATEGDAAESHQPDLTAGEGAHLVRPVEGLLFHPWHDVSSIAV